MSEVDLDELAKSVGSMGVIPNIGVTDEEYAEIKRLAEFFEGGKEGRGAANTMIDLMVRLHRRLGPEFAAYALLVFTGAGGSTRRIYDAAAARRHEPDVAAIISAWSGALRP